MSQGADTGSAPGNHDPRHLGSQDVIRAVRARANLFSDADAELATVVTLRVLGERLIGNACAELAEDLPANLGRLLLRDAPGEPEHFGARGFLDRAERLLATDRAQARLRVEAVLATVVEIADAGTMERVRAQLPEDFEDLLSVKSGEPPGETR